MPRKFKTAAASGKAALPQLSAQMLEELSQIQFLNKLALLHRVP